ncbi:hypothetical protein AVEN_21450-1 [Araneus ventricosus]|uniref:Uncharacterized protein n=1 Tax=Araneus ventricosus TaxID=182803 RepID=A0A4Y1ZRV3_ARAVE|nr:hypothetical protein AVEN_21450-1 [Araneus ventricosus]
MLERYLEKKSAISETLIVTKEQQILDNVEFETLTEIVAGLRPIKIGLEKLCSQKATLITAERVFTFISGELNKRNSEFAKNMKRSLVQRIIEKCNVSLVGLIQYLNFGRRYDAAAVTVDLERFPNKNSWI